MCETIHHAHIRERISSYTLIDTHMPHTTMDARSITQEAKPGLIGTVPSSTCHAGSITVLTLFEGQ